MRSSFSVFFTEFQVFLFYFYMKGKTFIIILLYLNDMFPTRAKQTRDNGILFKIFNDLFFFCSFYDSYFLLSSIILMLCTAMLRTRLCGLLVCLWTYYQPGLKNMMAAVGYIAWSHIRVVANIFIQYIPFWVF